MSWRKWPGIASWMVRSWEHRVVVLAGNNVARVLVPVLGRRRDGVEGLLLRLQGARRVTVSDGDAAAVFGHLDDAARLLGDAHEIVLRTNSVASVSIFSASLTMVALSGRSFATSSRTFFTKAFLSFSVFRSGIFLPFITSGQISFAVSTISSRVFVRSARLLLDLIDVDLII